METRRLGFMEIILRGPRLADGVWVPVVPGWAARLIVNGEAPTFLPAAAWSPSRRASPNTRTAYEPLGFRYSSGQELGVLLTWNILPCSWLPLKWLPCVQAAEPIPKSQGRPRLQAVVCER